MKLDKTVKEKHQSSEEEGVSLARAFLLSLDAPSDAEMAQDWLAEAYRHVRQLDDKTAQFVLAQEIKRKALALMRKITITFSGGSRTT
ncbi:MAG TPA: hypothetical protein VIM41_15175 [Gammaproteobacteria bacterium]